MMEQNEILTEKNKVVLQLYIKIKNRKDKYLYPLLNGSAKS